MATEIQSGVPVNPSAPRRTEAEAEAWSTATSLEASFLSEMLGYAGFGSMEGSFGGGIGEEQYSSFLRSAYAQKMSEAGGIGLAESIFAAISKRGAE